MKGKVFALLAFVMIFISLAFVSADLGTFKLGDCVPITTTLNATSANLSTINTPSPNPITIFINSPMTYQGSGAFNYSFCNTSNIGSYTYGYIDQYGNQYSNTFEISATGQPLNTSTALLYMLVLVVAVILFLIFAVLGTILPSKNKKDAMTGYIIALENLKYLKIFCWCAVYLTFMLIMYFSYIICYAFLSMAFLTSLFNIVFTIMAWGCLLFFPLMVFILIANAIRDNQVGKALTGGFRIKE